MKTLKLLILLLIFPIEMAFSQRERNYIYLFDCTQSMIYQVNIWSQTKQYLKDDIMKLSPTSTVSIVPFQNNSFPVVSFVRSHFKWEDVEKKLDEYIKSKSGTNFKKFFVGRIVYENNGLWEDDWELITDGNTACTNTFGAYGITPGDRTLKRFIDYSVKSLKNDKETIIKL